MLCGNRFSLPGSPSTCALDASITPLPSIFLLAFLLIYVPIKLRSRRMHPSSPSPYASSSFDAYKYALPGAHVETHTGFKRWIHYTYLVLVLCLFGLRILEISRLIAAGMGVALLPFGLIAIALVVIMLTYGGIGLGMGRARGMEISLSLVMYWALSTVLESVKVARLSNYNEFYPAKGTAYPSSDWLLDNGCMLGLLVVFLFIEGIHSVTLWRSVVLSQNGESIQSGSALGIRDKNISKPTLVFGTFA
ncbi:hypothetical protein EW145_g7341 [Phellinidium pouzarii]|uniref:Uncharacterized protein n=1 Tax=Phellinidium pouzarii TaxID=167371 RepID=A0A4V3XAQ3_9AGAM|nr:hypothetical protein EW145_g7341 [Phellinidium pouzarii]